MGSGSCPVWLAGWKCCPRCLGRFEGGNVPNIVSVLVASADGAEYVSLPVSRDVVDHVENWRGVDDERATNTE